MELQIIEEKELLGKNIKVYGTHENPLFLAKDIADWIDHSNTSKMISDAELDDSEIVKSRISTLTNSYSALFLTESGLHEVLMQSRKPIAREFKTGIKHILKEIRLKGGFIATSVDDSPELIMAKALQVAASTIESNKQKIKQLEIQNQIQSQEIQQSKPLLELAKDCYASTETMTASILSARLGFKSSVSLNKFLKDSGIQYKIKGDDCWKLTAKYSCNGYTKTIPYPYIKSDKTTGTRNQMEWTEAGFVFLREFINKKKSA
jgi:prophage antirepressor-like protein